MKLYPLIFRLHKIFSIVVGIQLLLWVISGLYMTAVPLTYVHGDHLRKESDKTLLRLEDLPAAVQVGLEEKGIAEVETVRLFMRLDEPVYEVEVKDDSIVIQAESGLVLDNLDAEQARQIAIESFTGSATVISVVEINNYAEMPEIKGRDLPIWQVNFDDWVSTSLYVSNTEARVITARSSIWRIFDFFWMLHIMDYEEREDFNNPLVIFMATAGILMVLSGAVLLIRGLQRSGTRYLK